MCLSSNGVGLLMDAEIIWCGSHLFQSRALFFSFNLYAPETATAYSEAVLSPSVLKNARYDTIQLQANFIAKECFVKILTVVLDLNGEQRLSLSVGHRHLIKASGS